MSDKPSYPNLPQLFLRGREELLRHFRPIISHFGLTEQQWRVLRTIAEFDEIEPREICKTCQILSPSLTGMLARMEGMGLVTRTRMAGDQRRVIVRITAKAERLVAELEPLIAKQYKIIEEAFGPALIQELLEVMDKVLATERRPIRQIKPPRPKLGD